MLKSFFQRLLSRLSSVKAHRQTKDVGKPLYEPMEEFSEEMIRECTVSGLQRTVEVLESNLYLINEKKEVATHLTVDENGKKQELMFPGAIPESYFLLLLRQEVRLTVKERAFYHSPGKWFCTESHVLEVLTGELAGQQFTGHKKWDDDYPPVVMRAKSRARQIAS